MNKFKVGTLVMPKKVSDDAKLRGLRDGHIGTVVTPHYLARAEMVCVNYPDTNDNNTGCWQEAPSNLISIGGPDIDLGEDIHMEFDTKVKKPVKEPA